MEKKKKLQILIIFLVIISNFNLIFLFINFFDNNNPPSNEEKRTEPIKAGTIITKHISSDTTWTLNGSPYYIFNNTVIEQGVKLTIEPGVEVLFYGYYSLIVDGALNAIGTPDNPIIFSSNATNPQIGDWESIYFRDLCIDSESIMKYVQISYAVNGIKVEDAGPIITNCVIYNNSDGVYVDIHFNAFTFPILESNTICNNSNAGVNFNNLNKELDEDFIFQYNEIFNNKIGIYFQSINTGYVRNKDFIVQYNKIYNNLEDGISIYRAVIYDGDFIFQYNEICNNFHSGINILELDFESGGHFLIQRINIYNNSDYAIKCHWTEYSKNVTATYNWWGTTNSTEIEQMIFDYYDDFNYARVVYDPFLFDPVIEIYNAEPPQWSNFQINDTSIYIGDNVNISIEVSDNVELSRVWIEINGISYDMAIIGGTDLYFYIFTPTQDNIYYNFTIYMEDTSGNLNSYNSSFFVNISTNGNGDENEIMIFFGIFLIIFFLFCCVVPILFKSSSKSERSKEKLEVIKFDKLIDIHNELQKILSSGDSLFIKGEYLKGLMMYKEGLKDDFKEFPEYDLILTKINQCIDNQMNEAIKKGKSLLDTENYKNALKEIVSNVYFLKDLQVIENYTELMSQLEDKILEFFDMFDIKKLEEFLIEIFEEESGENAIKQNEITQSYLDWINNIEDKFQLNRNKIQTLMSELLNIRKEFIREESTKKIKKDILDLGTKFTRVQVNEIAEKCDVKDEQLIIDIALDMIEKNEIYAEYFSSSKTIAFDQQANIEEIDRLMAAYKDWEDKKIKKK